MQTLSLRIAACAAPLLVAGLLALTPPATSSPTPAAPASACRC